MTLYYDPFMGSGTTALNLTTPFQKGRIMLRKWFSVLVVLVGGCLIGCASTPEAREGLSAQLDALEQARFKGAVTFESGGSIFGAHMRNSVWLGPAEQVLRFNGEVDFTESPRESEDTQ